MMLEFSVLTGMICGIQRPSCKNLLLRDRWQTQNCLSKRYLPIQSKSYHLQQTLNSFIKKETSFTKVIFFNFKFQLFASLKLGSKYRLLGCRRPDSAISIISRMASLKPPRDLLAHTYWTRPIFSEQCLYFLPARSIRSCKGAHQDRVIWQKQKRITSN